MRLGANCQSGIASLDFCEMCVHVLVVTVIASSMHILESGKLPHATTSIDAPTDSGR